MRKEKKEAKKITIDSNFVCPIAKGVDPWEGECKYVNDFYCRYASVAHLELALKKKLLNCPFDLDPEGNFD